MVMSKEGHSKHEFRVIAAGKFKATCLELMDEASKNKELTLIITKRGKPVAQLTAPPEGLKLSGPTVELHPAAAPVDLHASAPTEKPHKRKRKDKKKHK
jgi:antitoxin (DNA-binding transcriptional repressor) of toxin-antitoxin stability system